MILGFFSSAVIIGIALLFIRNKMLSHAMSFTFLLLLFFLCIYESSNLFVTQYRFFKADALSLIFLWMLLIITVSAYIHYIIFAEKRKEPVRMIAYHNAGFIAFVTAIAGALLSSHVGILWAFLEATTLSAAILIYHNRNPHSLEGTWKYIFICSVGIALAFAGILFLGIAGKEVSHLDFSIEILKINTVIMNPFWLKACFLFVLVGFSVKLGAVPLFNVDIDAKDVSPSPVGAMLSGALMNVGFVALFRFYWILSDTSILPWMNNVLVVTGLLTIFFAAIYLLKVKNYKRLFAYSSMEHAGIILIMMTLGKTGFFIAVLHLILHSFAKASLFFQIGQVHRVFQSKLDSETGGYFKINPFGGMVLLLGLLAIVAMPPSGLFYTEFLFFKELITEEKWWLAIALMFLLATIIFSMSKMILKLLFTPLVNRKVLANYEKINPLESVTQFVLLGCVFYAGIAKPAFLVDLINMAVSSFK